MTKKPSLEIHPSASLQEWNPNIKEKWFLEFEKEPVNDERWSCIVTAAIPNEAEEDKYIQTYTEFVDVGLRKCLKIISMSQVMKLLKLSNSSISSVKKEGKQKGRNSVTGKTPRVSPVIELASKYAIFTDNECILPPDLMAAVLKHIILTLKSENCYQKRYDAVRDRKIREQNLKAKFIRDLKPYQVRLEEGTSSNETSESSTDLKQPIKDEPVDGPDLYIMLTDFYNAMYFPALQMINVPFLAILKISTQKMFPSFDSQMTEINDRRMSLINRFWSNFNELCNCLQTTYQFKNIAVMEYKILPKAMNAKESARIIFDELTWMQYSVGYIHRQYQKYLSQLHVQRLFQSLEPLDLSTCEVYNKLCDVLITGEPLTPLLVLYAIIEQVVVGVPQSESTVLEYEQKSFDSPASTISDLFSDTMPILKVPCKECAGKTIEYICDKSKQIPPAVQSESMEGETLRPEDAEVNSELLQPQSEISEENQGEMSPNLGEATLEIGISKYLIERCLKERKTEKEIREDKIWKTPKLCFYGDFVFLQSYHCDPRLFSYETIVERFLKNATLFQIWARYPILPAGEKAFFNFHFFSLWKVSGLSKEILKLKIFFILSMKLIYKTEPNWNQIENNPPSEQTIKPQSKGKCDFITMETESFHNFFLKTFIIDKYFRVPKKSDTAWEDREQIVESAERPESQMQSDGATDWPLLPLTESECCAQICFRDLENQFSQTNKVFLTLHSLLECFEISHLTERRFLKRVEGFSELIKNFKLYEKLDSNLMIQRLIEAKENFNTIHFSYFSPTDTLNIVMHNDCDYRGIFTTYESGVLPTPVCFRDFYQYVYSEIGTWLIKEDAEHSRFTSEVEEKIKTKEEKKDAEYLATLKQQYCSMSTVQREEFLNTDVDIQEEPEVKKKELGELPIKPKFNFSSKVSFVTTNFSDLRIQNNKDVKEFHSQDGMQVIVTIDSWLYSSEELLKLEFKRSRFFLYYYQWLNKEELNADITFKTDTDIIFAFHKNTEGETSFYYGVTISWPSGLLIKPVPLGSKIYVKQSYLKTHRRGWDIERENSRCFLDTGRVIILKDNGDYDILFGSGTKVSYYNSSVAPKFEILSTTGEVWQVPTKGVCKNKRKLITNYKIFIGVDPNTKETFYKREDGVSCMLWKDGTLVTNYPDGTKITATPYFDVNEVTVEWTEDEKMYFTDLLSNYKSDHSVKEIRTRTILRNSSNPISYSKISFNVEGFVSVSCTYLMEHPKYSRIYFNPTDSYVTVTMQDNLSILMYPEGNYEVRQENDFLSVYGDVVEFYANCRECSGRSSITLNLDSNEILCKCVDFFRKAFYVYRDGRTGFEERYMENEEEFHQNTEQPCTLGHTINPCLGRRCFALERDLSGIEFLHEDSLALSDYQLPEEAFNADDPIDTSHTFNTPLYKIGYEKWVMNYEDEYNSLPKTIKKKDLKEMGVKQVSKNLYKYSFPKHHNCKEQTNIFERVHIDEPKVIVGRTVWLLSQNPESVIAELRKCVTTYQEKARGIFNSYINHKQADNRSQDSRYVEMKLRKIALTLSQSLQMYPHLCTNLPSTEKEIHYFGHFIKSWETEGDQIRDPLNIITECKQICTRFPRQSDFSCIYEESESSHES